MHGDHDGMGSWAAWSGSMVVKYVRGVRSGSSDIDYLWEACGAILEQTCTCACLTWTKVF